MFCKRKTKLLANPFVLILALGASFLVTNKVHAYSATITTSDISINASTTGHGTSIRDESINIISDCRGGYTLSIATSETSNLYLDGDDANNATGTYFSPVDGINPLSSSDNANKWGYTLTTNPSIDTVFSALSTTPVILKTLSETASPDADIDDTFSISYGVHAGSSMASGLYKMANDGAVVYYLTMEATCNSYIIQYEDNHADNPNGMGSTDTSTGFKTVKQTNIAIDTDVTLLPSNFKRTGYGFIGWSTDQDAYAHFTDNDDTNDPIIYGPTQTITVSSDLAEQASNKNVISLYAVWVPAAKGSDNSPIYFQDWDNPTTTLPHDGCSTLTSTTFTTDQNTGEGIISATKDSIIALTDKRDNEVYAVARLADGKCWMIENLRLEHEGTVGNNTNDSSVTNQSLSQGYGGTPGINGSFKGLASAENANFTNSTAANDMYKSDDSGDIFDSALHTLEDIGTTNYPAYRFPRYNNYNIYSKIDGTTYTQNYSNPASPSESGIYRTDTNLYSYGNYYTWAAAMANTNYYMDSSSSESAGTSICPAGWTLPSSNGTTKDFGNLSRQYGGNGGNQRGDDGATMSQRFRAFPNNFLYSGDINSSSAGGRGNSSFYWSQSSYNISLAYSMNLSPDSLSSSSSSYAKVNGFSVRCNVSPSNIEITLDFNDGADTVSRLYGEAESAVTLPTPSAAQPGYAFSGWNTAPDGSGTNYTSYYTIPAGSTGITLFAQWTPQFAINYVNNCLTYADTNANCTQTVSNGTQEQKIDLDDSGDGSGTLKDYNTWALTGWKIKGWSTVADNSSDVEPEYRAGTTYQITGQTADDSVTLYAHWVPVYSIQYDGNGADNPNGMGATDASTGIKSVIQTNIGQGDLVTLLPSNFKRSGYGFIGWSTDQDAYTHFTDNDDTNDPIIYGPIETISAPVYPNNGTSIITMYAVWVPAARDGNDDPIYFQEWDDPTDPTDGCATLAAVDFNNSATDEKAKFTVVKNSIIALTDKRDNEVYAVAKLADGKCWMIENLRLEHEGTVGDNINDPTVTNESLSQGYGGTPGTYGSFKGLADAEVNFNSTTANSIYKSDDSGSIFDSALSVLEDIGTSGNPSNRFPRYNHSNTYSRIDSTSYIQNYTNSTNPSSSIAYSGANIYSYGNYYTWAAAIANTNYYNDVNSTDAANKTSETVNTSICPSGWYLPSSSSADKEYGILSQANGGTGYNQNGNDGTTMSKHFRTFPNNFLYSGRLFNSSANNRGDYGYYWSRSSYDYDGAYHLSLYSSNLSPSYGGSYGKYYGLTVRCLIGS